MTNKILVMSTCGTAEEAEKIARDLVSQRLAACVNVVGGVRSLQMGRRPTRLAGDATDD